LRLSASALLVAQSGSTLSTLAAWRALVLGREIRELLWPVGCARARSIFVDRDFITAAVAILVGGLVGLVGVVVGCQSARDSQETAREAQREMNRLERRQEDLNELRQVLDQAVVDLQLLRVVAYQAVTAPSQRTGREIDRAVRATVESGSRILIRLGTESAAWRSFSEALNEYESVAEEGAASPVGRRFVDGDVAAERFREAALKLVGSQLPQ
jgi:prefoldin subunit 5